MKKITVKNLIISIIVLFIFFTGNLNFSYALDSKEYNLSGLVPFENKTSQYIDTFNIINKSDIIINVSFYDCTTDGEIILQLLETNYIINCKEGNAGEYEEVTAVFYNVEPGAYELYATTDDLNNIWGVGKIQTFSSVQGSGGSNTSNNVTVNEVNESIEGKKIYLFDSMEELETFMMQLWSIYLMIIILIFIINVFTKKTYDI